MMNSSSFSSKQTAWLFLSALLFILCAYFSKGYHHFDEHFQLLEFANWKAGKTPINDLPWEFHEKMRPALQVGLIYLFQKVYHFIGGESPFTFAFLLRLFSAALTFLLLIRLFKQFKEKLKASNAAFFFLCSFFLWYFYYIGVRFSSENWSALFLTFGISLLFPFEKSKKPSLFFISGLLFGFSFHFRYQIAFAILGFLLWLLFIQKIKLKSLISLVFGGLLSFSIGLLVDAWFYEEWQIAPWNYIEQNILEDKVSGFGVEPWWFYLQRFIEQGIPPLSILILGACFFFFIKKANSWLSWTLIPFLVVHTLIGHKELRFLFPIVYFLPFLLFSVYELLSTKVKTNKLFRLAVKLSWGVNLLFVLVVCFRPAEPQVPLYEALYKQVGDKKATLYHLGKNPYHRVANVFFYKPKNLTIKQIDSFESLAQSSKEMQFVVVGGKGQQIEVPIESKELTYSTFPEWFTKLNFNDWQSRTNVWKVYRLDAD
ncbi:MAG: glycosyltransferase family 39 protein [Vicingaceae bacterium]